MNANFPVCLAATLRTEGGYSDDPKDPGGPTMRGVTQDEYDDWRARQGLPSRAVLLIAAAEIAAIYRADYWDRCRCDDLPSGVDYAVFDFAVNSGDTRAERFLQRADGVVERHLQRAVSVVEDGVIGPETLRAVATLDPAALVDAICDLRIGYLQQLRGFAHDGNGWTARVASVRAAAKAMCAEVNG